MAVELSQQFSQETFTQRNDVNSDNTANILLHELQFGEQLNESVVETRRADFSLMLAMLNEDVREQSQFILPKPALVIAADHSNTALRKQFHLPKPASLSLKSLDDIANFNQAQSIADNNLAAIHLSNAMNPKPLAFRDNKQHIVSTVLDNTSVYCQHKHKHQQNQVDVIKKSAIENKGEEAVGDVDQQSDKPLNKVLNFNAKAWLDSIQQSLVTAPLIS